MPIGIGGAGIGKQFDDEFQMLASPFYPKEGDNGTVLEPGLSVSKDPGIERTPQEQTDRNQMLGVDANPIRVSDTQPDYDYQGWQAANPDARMSPGQHYPDTFKLPNHITFSNESKYSNDQTPGGKWEQAEDKTWTFTPSDHNLQNTPPSVLQDYFNRNEPGNKLNLDTPQGMAAQASEKARDALERAKGTPPTIDDDTGIRGAVFHRTPYGAITQEDLDTASSIGMSFSTGISGVGSKILSGPQFRRPANTDVPQAGWDPVTKKYYNPTDHNMIGSDAADAAFEKEFRAQSFFDQSAKYDSKTVKAWDADRVKRFQALEAEGNKIIEGKDADKLSEFEKKRWNKINNDWMKVYEEKIEDWKDLPSYDTVEKIDTKSLRDALRENFHENVTKPHEEFLKKYDAAKEFGDNVLTKKGGWTELNVARYNKMMREINPDHEPIEFETVFDREMKKRREEGDRKADELLGLADRAKKLREGLEKPPEDK